jgi:hypothetical protein
MYIVVVIHEHNINCFALSLWTSKSFNDKINYNSFEVYSKQDNFFPIINDIQQLIKYLKRKKFNINCSK